jgi:predicted RNA-binding Zn ribbon-like protein
MEPELLQLGEPLTVELANSLYVEAEERYDVLQEHPEAWLRALDLVVPDDLAPLRRLRDAVHHLASAQVDGTPVPSLALEVVNEFGRTPPAQQLNRVDGTWSARIAPPHDGASLPAFLAVAAIGFFATRAEGLRRCAASDCELVFLQTHRRRRFCHPTCSGRTRQAAYVERRRG